MSGQTLHDVAGRMILFAVVGLLLCCTTRAYGQGAAAAATEVRVTRGNEGLRLDYRLTRPQTLFRFDPEEHRSEAAVIQALTPNLTVSPDSVVGSKALRRFSLALLPDTRRVDSTYPVLARVGENGFMLYAPALKGDPTKSTTRFAFPRTTGDAVLGGTEGAGFVFIGPSSYVTRYGPLALVTPPTLPDTLRAALRDRATAVLDYYSKRLGRHPPQRPVLVASYDAQTQDAAFVGDVTPNGVILLQLPAALKDGVGGSDSFLSRFLAHEFFHLWNGGTYRDTAGLNGHWLREGSAEYAGWLAAEALWPQGQSLEERITAQLPFCMETLAADALVELEGQRSQTTRYSCGAITQWLADVAVRKAGRGDVLDVWSGLLVRPRGYDVGSFETTMRAHAAPYVGPLTSILRGKGRDRWPQMFTMLRSWGVHVDEVPPSTATLRNAALLTILREACQGDTIGFETMGLSEPPSAVILRTEPMGNDPNARCGPIVGDPRVARDQRPQRAGGLGSHFAGRHCCLPRAHRHCVEAQARNGRGKRRHPLQQPCVGDPQGIPRSKSPSHGFTRTEDLAFGW